MSFYWPQALYLFLLLPLIAWLLWRGYKLYRERLEKLLGFGLEKLAPQVSRTRQWLKASLIFLAAGLLIFSVARPRWGFEDREVSREGIDILVAIDVSQSMKAKDIQPDRLSRAKREIIDLLRVMRGDRIGLIPFAGVAFVQCPLTIDYSALETFLRHIDTDLIPVPGTAIGDAIRLATASFQSNGSQPNSGKALILITDGEDQASDPLEAAKEAAEAGILIFTIGIGAEEGAPIPGDHGEFLRDQSGKVVISRLDDGLLREIAGITGGSHLRTTTGDMGLEEIYLSKIRAALEAGELYQRQERIWYERFYWFSALAALALAVEVFIRD